MAHAEQRMDATDRPPPLRVPPHYESFYRTEYRRVVALTYGLTGSRWASEEIAQEAFLRAHRHWDRVGVMDNPGAWVRTVALNLARSRYRRLKAEAAARLRLANPSTIEPMTGDAEAFWSELRRLPRRQAEVLALRYVEDLDVADIADALGVAEGTVRALLHQGRTRLERQLVAKGWVET